MNAKDIYNKIIVMNCLEIMSQKPQPPSSKAICPVVESIYAIGNKWSLVIIHYLMNEPRRFNELKSCINGISSKVLAENLYELQENGIIEKKIVDDQPEKTEYVLTEKGMDLKSVMLEMRGWGEKWLTPSDHSKFEISEDKGLGTNADMKWHAAHDQIKTSPQNTP